MSSSDEDNISLRNPSTGVHFSWLESLVRLNREGGKRFLQNLGKAIFWQGLGRIFQLIGLAYALRCLGPANIGLSGTVIVTASYGQLVLDLGLDLVSVRHVAAGTVRLQDLVPAIFSLRFLIGVLAALVWLLVIMILPMEQQTRWVWAMGGAYLWVLTLSSSWYYQATERMHRFSLIQNATNIGVSACYLVFFRPGQAAGSDLAVMLVLTGAVTAVVWWQVRRSQKVTLFSLRSLGLARSLLKEGRPMWCFNLCYTALSSMGLPICYALLSEREGGYYRAAGWLATSIQMFLIYFSLMLYPRVVAWRTTVPALFMKRVLLIVGAVLGGSVVTFVCLWAARVPIMGLLGGADFIPAAPLLPFLVTGRFVAIASGVIIWALLASRLDWSAVQCCGPLVGLGLVLNIWLVPKYGAGAAAWLNCAMELALLVLCLATFVRSAKRRPVAE